MGTDFITDLLVFQVCNCPETLLFQNPDEFLHSCRLRVGDVRNYHLHRCQPQRQVARVVLDKNTYEALE